MRLALLRSLPLAVRVPLVVAGLMVAVSLVIGQVVLHRLARDQERHVADLAAAYLDGVSTAVLPAAIRRDVWEAYDALDRARARYQGLAIVFAVVTEPSGHVLAASDPRLFPVGSLLPEALLDRYGPDGRLAIDEAAALAFLARELREGAVPVGRILVELDIGALIAERRAVRWTLVAVNAGLTFLLAGLGVMLVRRMLGPVAILRAHVAAGAEGPIRPLDEALIARQPAEFAALFRAFNRTAQAVAEREAMAARLAAEEKYALLGKLASAMAHEVNNPLGGLFTAVDTLARHGADPAVRARSIGFLRRGPRRHPRCRARRPRDLQGADRRRSAHAHGSRRSAPPGPPRDRAARLEPHVAERAGERCRTRPHDGPSDRAQPAVERVRGESAGRDGASGGAGRGGRLRAHRARRRAGPAGRGARAAGRAGRPAAQRRARPLDGRAARCRARRAHHARQWCSGHGNHAERAALRRSACRCRVGPRAAGCCWSRTIP